MEYAKRLQDPRWQRKRLEILNRDNFTCLMCQSKNKELHVHHKYYKKGANIWDYPDKCYATLCYGCHEAEENFLKLSEQQLIQTVREFGMDSLDINALVFAIDALSNVKDGEKFMHKFQNEAIKLFLAQEGIDPNK